MNNIIQSIREKLTDNQIKSLDYLSRGYGVIDAASIKVDAYLDALVDADAITEEEKRFIKSIYSGTGLKNLYNIQDD